MDTQTVKLFSVLIAIFISEFILVSVFGMSWIGAYLKVGDQIIYLIILFVLLLISVVLLLDRIKFLRFPSAILLGVLCGHCVGLIALIIYSFLLPDGVSIVRNTLELGIGSLIFTQNIGAFMLGGWLIGGVAYAAIKYMTNKLRI